MTITKRSLSVAYLILLLTVGVVLAAELLLDGERNAGPKKNASQIDRDSGLFAQSGRGSSHA